MIKENKINEGNKMKRSNRWLDYYNNESKYNRDNLPNWRKRDNQIREEKRVVVEIQKQIHQVYGFYGQ